MASISVPSKFPPTLTLPSLGHRAEALDVVDLVLLEQAADAAGQRRDHLLAALATFAKSTVRPSTVMPKSPASSISERMSADRRTAFAGMQA